jgi:hypothetical protein
VTELEEILQDDEPATLPRTIAIIDKCVEDLSRLMKAGGLKCCIHSKNLVFGLGHAQDMLRQLQHQINAIYNEPKK